MAQADPTVSYSKKLCEDAKALREASKVAIAESKNVIARSQRTVATIKLRMKKNQNK